MTTETISVQIPTQFETRPIAMLVQVASQYESQIYLEVGERRVNAKSIMGMMTLGLDNGSDVVVTAEGKDEQEALEGVKEYLSRS